MSKWREELSKIRDTIAFHTKYVCAEEWKDDKLDEYESKLTQVDKFALKIEKLLQQIEDMKCCENCSELKTESGECEYNNRFIVSVLPTILRRSYAI